MVKSTPRISKGTKFIIEKSKEILFPTKIVVHYSVDSGENLVFTNVVKITEFERNLQTFEVC